MREIFYVWKDRTCLRRMAVSGVLFLLVATPFKLLFGLIPGVTEIRPANMLPVVFGLMWGPAGAWGTALANACADIFVSHSPAVVWLPGFIINFFFAYLPYRMWYSIQCGKGVSALPRLESVNQIAQFVYVCLLDSLVITACLGLLFEALGFQQYSDSVMLLFFNNLDFTIVLGVPVILLMTNFQKEGIWIPMEIRDCERENKKETRTGVNRFDLMLYLIVGAGIFYLAAERLGFFSLPAEAAWGLLAVTGVVLCIYLTKPMDPLEKKQEHLELSGVSIRAKVIIGFLVLSVTFVVIVGVVAYLSMEPAGDGRRAIWQYIYLVIGIAMNFLFMVSLVFLRYVENNITSPIERLSVMTGRFAAGSDGGLMDRREFLKGVGKIQTGDEIEHLSDSFRKMMEDITVYVEDLKVMTREKERVGAELNVAAQIQADMLPRVFPPFPDRKDFDIYASMKPAKGVGGDFYDFYLVDDNHLAVVIADVSGKGVPAALFMVIVKTLIKNHAQFGSEPADIFTIVNNQLCEGNEAGLFVTAWLGILTLSTGELKFVNAGHNPPLLFRGSGEFEYLKSPAGFVLAGIEDFRYTQSRLTLEPGAKLFLYTDGVTEAENSSQEQFGDKRLKEILNALDNPSAEGMIKGVKESLKQFTEQEEQFDDITMTALCYAGRRDE